jgi:tetratricopeptide (TPR) repeat protein
MSSIERNGVAMIPAEGEALRRLEHALQLLHTHRGNPAAEVDRILADDPCCMLGHGLRAALIVRADDAGARPSLAASLAAIEAAHPDRDDAMHRHAAAARAWLDGDSSLALERYGAIVADRPHDIVALVVAHALDFRLGRRHMLRDRIARVLRDWNASMPGYASVLAMYAFGLEENGQYRRAEEIARRALALDPEHPGAIHAMVHVMEMQGRAADGLAFLAATESSWIRDTGFSVHLAWHRALFHLDRDDPGSALATYDDRIATADASTMSALADASALLWRLQLQNVNVGARWRSLADRWEVQTLAGARPFYSAHAMMAFAAAGRAAPAAHVIEVLEDARTRSVSGSPPEEALAHPLCEALLAFARGDYSACIERLVQVRHVAHRCGGSLAQCDLIHLTFTEAALRAQKAGLARALVAERAAQKPTSRLNRLLKQRLGLMPAMA